MPEGDRRITDHCHRVDVSRMVARPVVQHPVVRHAGHVDDDATDSFDRCRIVISISVPRDCPNVQPEGAPRRSAGQSDAGASGRPSRNTTSRSSASGSGPVPVTVTWAARPDSDDAARRPPVLATAAPTAHWPQSSRAPAASVRGAQHLFFGVHQHLVAASAGSSKAPPDWVNLKPVPTRSNSGAPATASSRATPATASPWTCRPGAPRR